MATRPPLSKLAIVIGISVEIVGTMVAFAGALVVMFAAARGRGGQFDAGAMDDWIADPVFLVAAFVLGTVSLIIAGFATGKIAGRDHVRHAAWTGAILLALYVVLTLIPTEGPREPLWYEALSLMTTVPAAMLGGYLAAPKT